MGDAMIGYLPDDCNECRRCSTPFMGHGDICLGCESDIRHEFGLDDDWRDKDGKYRYGLALGWDAGRVADRDSKGRFVGRRIYR